MGILIGMDEAGYGPHFGPLVVAATAWEVSEEDSGFGVQGLEDGETASSRSATSRSTTAVLAARSKPASRATRGAAGSRLATTGSDSGCIDLYRLLRNIVAKSISERRIAIADSKVLFHPGLGLRQLERGVHAVLCSIGETLDCWTEIVRYCNADPDDQHRVVCWPDGFNCPLPVNVAADELARLAARFARACEASHVRPLLIRARLVFPAQFNELVDYYGTKGGALSHVTVGLLREVVDDIRSHATQPPASSPHSPIVAVCDKHGGRNYYTALLQHHFSEHWIEPVFERHAESRYEWGPAESRIRVTFRMQGERFLPTALASMTAKYLRELSMRAFNEFWAAHVKDLRPTAGYPTDSNRFRKAIAAKQRELGIEDRVFWRKR
jgi:ribonuclease HII